VFFFFIHVLRRKGEGEKIKSDVLTASVMEGSLLPEKGKKKKGKEEGTLFN